jgi:hypothetical protein
VIVSAPPVKLKEVAELATFAKLKFSPSAEDKVNDPLTRSLVVKSGPVAVVKSFPVWV